MQYAQESVLAQQAWTYAPFSRLLMHDVSDANDAAIGTITIAVDIANYTP